MESYPRGIVGPNSATGIFCVKILNFVFAYFKGGLSPRIWYENALEPFFVFIQGK